MVAGGFVCLALVMWLFTVDKTGPALLFALLGIVLALGYPIHRMGRREGAESPPISSVNDVRDMLTVIWNEQFGPENRGPLDQRFNGAALRFPTKADAATVIAAADEAAARAKPLGYASLSREVLAESTPNTWDYILRHALDGPVAHFQVSYEPAKTPGGAAVVVVRAPQYSVTKHYFLGIPLPFIPKSSVGWPPFRQFTGSIKDQLDEGVASGSLESAL